MGTNNIILIIMLLSITFNAIGDGLRIRDYEKHSKTQGILYHIFNAVAFGILFTLLFLPDKDSITRIDALWYLLSFACIRFGIFDFILNTVAGKHFLYLGDTAGIDKLLKRIFNTPTKLGILASLRSIIFIIGLVIVQHII